MKLTVKIAILTITIFVIASAIMMGVMYVMSKQYIVDGVASNQLITARYTVNAIDRFLFERYANVQAFAVREQIIEYLGAKKESTGLKNKLRDELSQTERMYDSWLYLSVIDRKGTRVVSTNPGYENINIISQKEKELVAVFEKSIKGQVTFSDIFMPSDTKIPTMVFMAPVYDVANKNEIVGVVEGHIKLSSIIDILKQIGGKDVHIINNNGFEIASTHDDFDPSRIFEKNHKDNLTVNLALQGSEDTIFTRELYGEYDSFESFVQQKGFGEFGGNGWVLIIESPRDKVDANLLTMVSVLTVSFVVFGAILCLIIMAVFHTFIIKRIKSLTSITQLIAGGDLSLRVKDRSKDEIGILSQAFNNMTEQLESLKKNFEEKVEEKTRDLQKQTDEAQKLNQLTIGRELKMLELKKEIENLTKKKSSNRKKK